MKTILVIDNNETFRVILADWLRTEGFYPITAENGFEGIQLARSHCPDLVLCDVNMPEMNGVEVLKQLRNDRNTLRIPFFFLTSDRSLNLSLIQQLGATGIIKKDAEIDKLRQALVQCQN
ncbi:response regulator [Oscillatoria sp. FACHB-1407]|uniref:response regulator n=1 Tax=Oscillatoria sp. FACHB-1407 TaxID=2692847 RepID=UPI00168856D7|nr:response regulator [Oscillatoria sp. FACHB-1407]MBD2464763.1 response regulator [Oscillatoria sp. FACHB-1407]